MLPSATHGFQRASMEDLESHLLSSRRVREFLKSFSATQWPRVVKATLMLGIQELERRDSTTNRMSAKDIEDFVGKQSLDELILLFYSAKRAKAH